MSITGAISMIREDGLPGHEGALYSNGGTIQRLSARHWIVRTPEHKVGEKGEFACVRHWQSSWAFSPVSPPWW